MYGQGLIDSKEEERCNLASGKIQIIAKNSNTIILLYYYTTKAVVVANFSNVLLPLLDFAVYTEYY